MDDEEEEDGPQLLLFDLDAIANAVHRIYLYSKRRRKMSSELNSRHLMRINSKLKQKCRIHLMISGTKRSHNQCRNPTGNFLFGPTTEKGGKNWGRSKMRGGGKEGRMEGLKGPKGDWEGEGYGTHKNPHLMPSF